MIPLPNHPDADRQNWMLDAQINKYVEEILAMVLPENASKTTEADVHYAMTGQTSLLQSEESIARQLIKDFTTMQVYSYELQKLNRRSINSLSFGGEMTDYKAVECLPKYCQEFAFRCLDAGYVANLLQKSSPRPKHKKVLNISRNGLSRYANRTLKSNPNAKYHQMRLDFENDVRYDISRVQLSDIENDTLIQMKPILLLRDMFSSGFDITNLIKEFKSHDYTEFQRGIELLKNNYTQYLTAFLSFKDAGYNPYSPQGKMLVDFTSAYYPGMMESCNAFSKVGIRALDSQRIMTKLHKYKEGKDYVDVIKEYYDIFEGDFQNVPENPKERKRWLQDFNDRVVKTIINSTDAEVDEDKIRKSLTHYENTAIRKVKLGLSPLSKSFRRKDVERLSYTTNTHRKEMISKIESGTQKTSPLSVIATSAITMAASLGIYLSSPMNAPDVPVISNGVIAAIGASGISKLIEQAILKEKNRTIDQDESLTGLGRMMLEGRYLLYNLLHTQRTKTISEEEMKPIISRLMQLSKEERHIQSMCPTYEEYLAFAESSRKSVEEVRKYNEEMERISRKRAAVLSADPRAITHTLRQRSGAELKFSDTEAQRRFWQAPPPEKPNRRKSKRSVSEDIIRQQGGTARMPNISRESSSASQIDNSQQTAKYDTGKNRRNRRNGQEQEH